jgi:hypothetical protein
MRAPDVALPGKHAEAAECLDARAIDVAAVAAVDVIAADVSTVSSTASSLKPRPPTEPPAPPETARAASRRAFIEETAAALGRTWAVRRRRDLHGEGRAASGGWPGTLHEARALVHHALPGEMRGRKMNAITEVEREMAVRTAYANARDEWRRHVDPEPP